MKVLIVSTHHNIFEQKIGAQYRILNLAKQIARSCTVQILQPDRFYIKDPEFKCYLFKEHKFSFLRSIGWDYIPLFTDLNLNFIFTIRKILKFENPDIVQVEYPWGLIAVKLISLLTTKKTHVVYDSHDVQFFLIQQFIEKILNNSNSGLKYFIKPFISYIFLQEKIACKMADNILTVSKEDNNTFQKLYKISTNKIIVIPSGVNNFDEKSIKRLSMKDLLNKYGLNSTRPRIIFHGAYSHFPNREAIKLIESTISPELSDFDFIIAGTNVPKIRRENLHYLGFVEDLNSLLASSDIAIVPIISGGGTRIKILDYMNIGLPVISTKKGIEGIAVNNFEHAIVIDDVNELFIEAIRYLVENKSERQRIGKNGLSLIRTSYNWTIIGENLNKEYFSLKDNIA